jgi:hypothetical protein
VPTAKAFLFKVRNLLSQYLPQGATPAAPQIFRSQSQTGAVAHHRRQRTPVAVAGAQATAGILNGLVFCCQKMVKMCHIQFENPWHLSDTRPSLLKCFPVMQSHVHFSQIIT